MILPEEIIEIGKFFKAHGLKGEMNVVTDYDPSILEEGYPMIVDMEGLYVPFYAESVRPKGAQSSLVKIDGINTKEETQTLVNKTIYMLRRDVADFLDVDITELEQDTDIVGYTLNDINLGEIGIISDMDYSTVNILMTLTVPNATDENETITIPFRENFIIEISEQSKSVDVDLPESIREIIKM
ncbi:MAG: hypothetical protein K2H86_06440 [Muribaculaceae bacterium]|nr:hypothetical protein [Muribaculaceae bacterium]